MTLHAWEQDNIRTLLAHRRMHSFVFGRGEARNARLIPPQAEIDDGAHRVASDVGLSGTHRNQVAGKLIRSTSIKAKHG